MAITAAEIEEMTNMFQPTEEVSGVAGGGPALFIGDTTIEMEKLAAAMTVMNAATQIFAENWDNAGEAAVGSLQAITQALFEAALAGSIFKAVTDPTGLIIGLAAASAAFGIIKGAMRSNRQAQELKVRGRDLRGAALNEDKANRGLGA